MSDETRLRCGACGNLTRFDVTSTKRTKQFVHYTIDGEPRIEEEEILSNEVELVTCRWCGSSDSVERVPRVTSG